jgi:hypothetical protein
LWRNDRVEVPCESTFTRSNPEHAPPSLTDVFARPFFFLAHPFFGGQTRTVKVWSSCSSARSLVPSYPCTVCTPPCPSCRVQGGKKQAIGKEARAEHAIAFMFCRSATAQQSIRASCKSSVAGPSVSSVVTAGLFFCSGAIQCKDIWGSTLTRSNREHVRPSLNDTFPLFLNSFCELARSWHRFI